MKGLRAALPRTRSGGAIVAMAALTGLATLAIGAGLLLDAVRLRAEEAGRQVTVAVLAADPLEQAARGATLAAMLRRRPELRDVRLVPDAQVLAEAGGGPLPTLVDATLVKHADDAPLARALAGLPGVALTRAAPVATHGLTTLERIARIVAMLALAGGVALGLALMADGAAVELLERLGASDAQIARAAAGAVLPHLLAGSLVGAAIALPFIVWQARMAEGLGMQAIPLAGWVALALAPFALTLAGGAGVLGGAWLRLRRRP